MADSQRLKRNPDVSWRVIEGQAVLILNKEGEVQVLNELGTFIWEHAEVEAEELVHQIVSVYDVSPEEARRDLVEFVDTLLASGLLQKR